jgi:uncharacterized membrane protein YgdD (TMEM256/DUF423 family)
MPVAIRNISQWKEKLKSTNMYWCSGLSATVMPMFGSVAAGELERSAALNMITKKLVKGIAVRTFIVLTLLIILLPPLAEQKWAPIRWAGPVMAAGSLHFSGFTWLPMYILDPPQVRGTVSDGPEYHTFIYSRIWVIEIGPVSACLLALLLIKAN